MGDVSANQLNFSLKTQLIETARVLGLFAISPSPVVLYFFVERVSSPESDCSSPSRLQVALFLRCPQSIRASHCDGRTQTVIAEI